MRQKLTITSISKLPASGVVAAGTYLPCQLRESASAANWTAIKLKKAAVRKDWKWQGDKYKGGESSLSLPSPHDSQAGGGCSGLLFTLLSEGGQPVWPTE